MNNIMIYEDEQEYMITHPQKGNKLTYYIPKKNVNNLLTCLSKIKKTDNSLYTYREIASQLIKFYKLDIPLDSFNGGYNRGTYFKLYYYPIKILEYKGIIEYSKGRVGLVP